MALAVLALAGCKRKQFEVSTNAYIVGAGDDIVPLSSSNEPEISPNVLNASVLIATRLHDKRVKFCSGSLIAAEAAGQNYRIVANHHCFAVADDDDKATPELLPEACTFTKVYFGYVAGRTDASTELDCQPDSLRTNFDGDLAVFTLSANPPETYKPLDLWDGDDAPAGRSALIIHYPDVETAMAVPPDGGAELPTAQATINDCKTLGAFAVDEWDLDRTLPFSLRHTCDLIHGSSGSGLVDVETGKLLGVNWGGIKISDKSGIRTDNVATRASFLAAFLNRKTDEVVQAAQARRSEANALAATRKDDSSLKKTSMNLAEELKKKSCGTIGETKAASPRSVSLTAAALLFGLGLLPVALAGVCGRGKRVWAKRL